jgi:hypothetical protein
MSNEEYDLKGFNRITVKFAMEVDIIRADEFSIKISGSDTQLDNIKVIQEDERLSFSYDINLMSVLAAPFSRMHARITLPDLRELRISGAVRGTVKGFSSPNDFYLNIAGASRLDITGMEVGNMKWDLSGASRINGEVKSAGDFDLKIAGASRVDLKGSAKNVSVDAAGASYIDLDDFQIANAKVKLTGASHSFVNLNGKLDVSLEGASKLEYNGQPSMGEVRVTGASNLKHR